MMKKKFNKDDETFMKLALEKAQAGVQRGQTPFGSCIVQSHRNRSTVIAIEHNEVWKTTDITAHAEVRAIRAACLKLRTISLKDCVIYSTCEPCPMCFSACHWAGLKTIYYGAGIHDAKAAGFRELFIPAQRMKSLGKSPIRVYGGLLKKENAALLKAWGRIKGKRVY